MRIEVEEFILQVKDELLCFEGMEEKACEWEKQFREWMKTTKVKKQIMESKGKFCIGIKDEEEIFEVADSYIDAISENNIAKYWNEF